MPRESHLRNPARRMTEPPPSYVGDDIDASLKGKSGDDDALVFHDVDIKDYVTFMKKGGREEDVERINKLFKRSDLEVTYNKIL